MKRETDITAQEVGKQKEIINALELKSEDQDKRIFETNTEVEGLKMNVSIMQRTVRGLEGRTGDLEEKDEAQDKRIDEIERALTENEQKTRELDQRLAVVGTGSGGGEGVDSSAVFARIE